MRYKLLGKSGLRVSELCLGTMTFGDVWQDWGLATSKDESRKIFDGFADAGGNFIDTANKYNEGKSESLLGGFIESDRDHFVVATKYTLSTREGDPNACGNHRKNMACALEASLKRLKTDYIDLYWVHAWDFTTPVEEMMRGLDDMVRAGKVLYLGISDAPAWIVAQANTLAQVHGWSQFVGLQIEYSLAQRDPERDLIPMARAFDIGVTAWSPLAGGILSGKYAKTTKTKPETARHAESNPPDERKLRIGETVMKLADEIGRPASQVALNWLRQRQALTIPIIGARRAEQIQDNLKCLDWQLTSEQIAKLDEATKIELASHMISWSTILCGKWCSVEPRPPSITITHECSSLRGRASLKGHFVAVASRVWKFGAWVSRETMLTSIREKSALLRICCSSTSENPSQTSA
jgi:aryl-alcohol dehydrogenase-like predicted oxidoreductase